MNEHFDVLIVGAGLSGIGAACHLQRDCPDKSYAILESREAIGGTWDLFRYPGIRSDSDMFTLGYSFKPWLGEKSIADGASILDYIRDAAQEHGVGERVRFGHRVLAAEWSSAEAQWTVRAERPDGEPVTLTCNFLHCCTGYYRYDEGFAPKFDGRERFEGTVVHPQHWPEDLDYEGKRVVVIGSGATAITLVPAMAGRASHVTMLQRSPTYVFSLLGHDPIANALRRFLPRKTAYSLARWKNALLTILSYRLSRRAPGLVRRIIRRAAEAQLPEGYEVERHFNPSYDPWDQRLCVVPRGDLFRSIREGNAEIVTDRIATFTEKGLRLESGKELEADVIVTATGLNLLMLGGMRIVVDGRQREASDAVAYKGMMLSGIPNLALAVGYTNASFTLKTDLVAEYVCRLLKHMDAHDYRAAIPRAPGPNQSVEPFIDLQAGYILRSRDQLPLQGATQPWRLHQNYFRDIRLLKRGPVDDAMDFLPDSIGPLPGGRKAHTGDWHPAI